MAKRMGEGQDRPRKEKGDKRTTSRRKRLKAMGHSGGNTGKSTQKKLGSFNTRVWSKATEKGRLKKERQGKRGMPKTVRSATCEKVGTETGGA